MKNKWYLIMGIFACILSLFGCSQKPVKPETELTSISISQNHMDRTYCYSFWARKVDGEYLLDADCMLNDDEYTEIKFTDTQITEEDFKQFTRLDEKYNFFSLLKSHEEKKSKVFALDETVANFAVKYGEEVFSLDTNGDCYNDVYECFVALAEKYNTEI